MPSSSVRPSISNILLQPASNVKSFQEAGRVDVCFIVRWSLLVIVFLHPVIFLFLLFLFFSFYNSWFIARIFVVRIVYCTVTLECMRNPKNHVVFNHEILPDVVFNHVENGRRTDILEPLEKRKEYWGCRCCCCCCCPALRLLPTAGVWHQPSKMTAGLLWSITNCSSQWRITALCSVIFCIWYLKCKWYLRLQVCAGTYTLQLPSVH